MIILIVFTSCKNTDKTIEENKAGHSLKEKVKDDMMDMVHETRGMKNGNNH